MAKLARVARKLDRLYDSDGDYYDVKKVLVDVDTKETWYWMYVSHTCEEELRKLDGLYLTDPTEEDADE